MKTSGALKHQTICLSPTISVQLFTLVVVSYIGCCLLPCKISKLACFMEYDSIIPQYIKLIHFKNTKIHHQNIFIAGCIDKN